MHLRCCILHIWNMLCTAVHTLKLLITNLRFQHHRALLDYIDHANPSWFGFAVDYIDHWITFINNSISTMLLRAIDFLDIWHHLTDFSHKAFEFFFATAYCCNKGFLGECQTNMYIYRDEMMFVSIYRIFFRVVKYFSALILWRWEARPQCGEKREQTYVSPFLPTPTHPLASSPHAVFLKLG